jgi:hypothetical protein
MAENIDQPTSNQIEPTTNESLEELFKETPKPIEKTEEKKESKPTEKKKSGKEISDTVLRGLVKGKQIDISIYEKQITEKYEPEISKALISKLKEEIEKDKENEDKIPPRDMWVRSFTINNTIFESVLLNGVTIFLSYNSNPEIKEFIIRWRVGEKYETESKIYHPEEAAEYKPYSPDFVKLVTGVMKNEIKVPTITELFDDIYNLISEYLCAPPEYYILLTCFILETYVQNKLNAIGYLGFTGAKNSGKTRLGELVLLLAYRPYLGAKINSANVYDFIGSEGEGGDCTLIQDEAQTLADNKNPDNENTLAVYRQGYRKGVKVRRILDPSSKTRTHLFYNSYCAKLFLGYSLPRDEGLQSRLISNVMIEAPNDWAGKDEICITEKIVNATGEEEEINKEDERFKEIRNKLLLARMIHYFEPVSRIKMEEKGRIKEIWTGKLMVVIGTKYESEVRKMIKKYSLEERT